MAISEKLKQFRQASPPREKTDSKNGREEKSQEVTQSQVFTDNSSRCWWIMATDDEERENKKRKLKNENAEPKTLADAIQAFSKFVGQNSIPECDCGSEVHWSSGGFWKCYQCEPPPSETAGDAPWSAITANDPDESGAIGWRILNRRLLERWKTERREQAKLASECDF